MDEENEPTLEEKQKYNEELFKFTQDVDEKVKELCSYFGFDFDNINKHVCCNDVTCINFI